jgi:hypothetical protein
MMDSSSARSSTESAGNSPETPRWLPWLWAVLVLAGTLTYVLAARLGDRHAAVKVLLAWWREVLGL